MKKILILSLVFMPIFLISCYKKQPVKLLQDIVLSEGWQFKQADSSIWYKATIPGCIHTDLLANHQIQDPFYRINERALQWIDKKDWEYRTTFTLDKATLAKSNKEIHFDGLDTYADVYVNDSLVLKADNMFRQWDADVKRLLHEGKNTLRIYFHSPIKIGLQKLSELGYPLPADNDQSENGELGDKKVSVFTRKAGYHYGWDWGPRFVTSGIWRKVHLLAWDKARIEQLQVIQQKISKESAILNVNVEINATEKGNACIRFACQNVPSVKTNCNITFKEGLHTYSFQVKVAHPILWWTNGLGKPFLYDFTCSLEQGSSDLDTKNVSIGIRTVKIIQKPDKYGKSFYVELNGIPVFMKGANYIPNDNFLNRVTPGIYDKVINSAVNSHLNMLRVWGGGIYEDDYFYDQADRHGLLLWHDFMFACSMYPGDSAFLNNVKIEIQQNLIRLRNHPSIALWCGNNEIDGAWAQNDENGGWGWKKRYDKTQRASIWKAYDTLFHKIIPGIVGRLDSGRFYWPSSPVAGWYEHADLSKGSGDTHYWDVWWGQKPFSDYTTHIGRFMSEYGFQSFPEFKTIKTFSKSSDWDIFSEVMKAHQRSSIGNGTIRNYMERDYKVPTDFQKFLYVGQVLQAEGIKIAIESHRNSMPYCMGSLFWQINDCWPVASWSSIDYYHRWKAQQYFAKKGFENVMVSGILKNDSVLVHITSDLLENKSMSLQLNVMNFNGVSLFFKKIPVVVLKNTSAIYFSQELKQLTDNHPLNQILLSIKVISSDTMSSENILYFQPVKNMILPVSNLQKDISEDRGTILLQLKTDKLVKNLYLQLQNGNGFFSDNYFDMLPGETKIVRYLPEGNEKIDVKEFQQRLKWMQMKDIE